jgi:hypothetical protein
MELRTLAWYFSFSTSQLVWAHARLSNHAGTHENVYVYIAVVEDGYKEST